MISFTILIIEFLLLNLLVTSRSSVALIVVFIALFSVGFVFDVTKGRRVKNVAKPILAGYLFRVFLLFFDIYGRGLYCLPNSGADTEWFYSMGVLQAQERVNSSELLIKLTGVAINFLGNSRLYLQFLLMLCSMLAILFANKIMDEIDIALKKRRRVLYFLGLLPNYAILSSIFLRESIVTMLITISLYYFVRWWKGRSESNFWVAFVFVFSAATFHSGAIGVALGYILVRLLYNRKAQCIKVAISTIIPAVIFIFVFIYLYNNYGELLFGKMLGIESINDVAQENVVGGSSYAAYAGNSNSIASMILYTPIRMIMFQFSPFIWQIRGLGDIIAMVFDSFYFMYVVYRAFKYTKFKNAENSTLVILLMIIAFSTTFIFGWGVTNTGTALRHRNKMAVLYAVLLGLTMKPVYVEQKEYRH